MELADALQLTAGVAASLASGGLLPPPPERPSLRRLDALRKILNAVAAAAEKSLRVRPLGRRERAESGPGPLGRRERAESGPGPVGEPVPHGTRQAAARAAEPADSAGEGGGEG